MNTERERSYSASRIRAALREYLAPRIVDQVLAELGEDRRTARKSTPSAEDHAEAARRLRRYGITRGKG